MKKGGVYSAFSGRILEGVALDTLNTEMTSFHQDCPVRDRFRRHGKNEKEKSIGLIVLFMDNKEGRKKEEGLQD